ncbi:M48 family metallopeptidase [Candidatus Gracilibacteria bacterium]|nr:M48 family metallopeptidase [Candidatus Gracilibacteria bacterium]
MQKITLPIEETKEDRVSPSKPDFSWAGKMLMYSAIFIISSFLFFYSFSYFIVSKISIEKEKEIFGDVYLEEDLEKFDTSLLTTKIKELEKYNIYIQNDDEINAFASPGANIFINTGLLENVKNEEEIIFILAHEIGHIENRHILKRFSLQIPFTMTLSFLGIDLGGGIIDTNDLIGNFFSRQDETESDAYGIEILNKNGLNLKCATNFFETLEKERFLNPPEILSTHPTDKHRINNILQKNTHNNKPCKKWKYKKDTQ